MAILLVASHYIDVLEKKDVVADILKCNTVE
jgi:hypothetical protein